MTDKWMTVEEIAIGLCKNPTKHGRVTCPYCLPIAQALLSFAAQEAEPLVQALEKMNSPETDWEDGEVGVGYRFRVIALEALTAHRQKYPKEKS